MTVGSPIKILGAGPTGSLMAIALSKVGANVTILDNKPANLIIKRSRAYAITHSTRLLFEKINLWEELKPYLIPFRKLIVKDERTSKSIHFTNEDLPLNTQNFKYIGWIINHEQLMKVLLSNINNDNNISPLLDSSTFRDRNSYELIIAANGTRSDTKKQWGIGSYKRIYKQGCITAKVILRGTTYETAYEIFRDEGPLAILPLGGDIFQVVWSAPVPKCIERCQLSQSAFLDRLATVLPTDIDPDILLDKPAYFPISLSVAKSFYKGRGVLLGEAAHSCHPVGGQGLNLCWRDVSDLMNLFERLNLETINISHIPKEYSRYRILDVIFISFFTDLLINIFSNNNFFIIIIRKTGFKLMNRLSLLRRLALKFMSFGPMTIHKKLS